MSSVTVPTGPAKRPERTAPAWLLSQQMWAGMSIAVMWLAVLPGVRQAWARAG
jgi:hypothetical protein